MALIDEARDLTSLNTGLTLVIAFNYGARAEITKGGAGDCAQGRAR